MKFTKSHLLTIVYALFTLLYTLYIGQQVRRSIHYKGDDWWYFFKFLVIDGYLFFIFQGLLLRSRNWGVLLLLPVAILVADVLAGLLLLVILRWGGGTLLNRDLADMILLSVTHIGMSFYSLRFIR